MKVKNDYARLITTECIMNNIRMELKRHSGEIHCLLRITLRELSFLKYLPCKYVETPQCAVMFNKRWMFTFGKAEFVDLIQLRTYIYSHFNASSNIFKKCSAFESNHY